MFALLSYALMQRNFDVISTAFNQYLDCVHSNWYPEEDCILLFRKYANTELSLAADFTWQTTSVVIPTVFFFGYKQVRELWISIITLRVCSATTCGNKEPTDQAISRHL
jgi:hypothetical protein